MLPIHIKKLCRIERPGHRVTGNRRDLGNGAGSEIPFVPIDDHTRTAFTAMHADERTPSAVQLLRGAVAYCARLGITVRRLLTAPFDYGVSVVVTVIAAFIGRYPACKGDEVLTRIKHWTSCPAISNWSFVSAG